MWHGEWQPWAEQQWTSGAGQRGEGHVDWAALAQAWIAQREADVDVGGSWRDLGVAGGPLEPPLRSLPLPHLHVPPLPPHPPLTHPSHEGHPPPPPSEGLGDEGYLPSWAALPSWSLPSLPGTEGGTRGNFPPNSAPHPEKEDEFPIHPHPHYMGISPYNLSTPAQYDYQHGFACPTPAFPGDFPPPWHQPLPHREVARHSRGESPRTTLPSTVEAPVTDASKRRSLPAWIREGLEKLEREKQKQREQEKEFEGKTGKDEAEAEDMVVEDDAYERPPQRSKFDSNDEEEEEEMETRVRQQTFVGDIGEGRVKEEEEEPNDVGDGGMIEVEASKGDGVDEKEIGETTTRQERTQRELENIISDSEDIKKMANEGMEKEEEKSTVDGDSNVKEDAAVETTNTNYPDRNSESETEEEITEEEKQILMVSMVKVILTEVLLEVTNEEMATVAAEERRKACKKAARQKAPPKQLVWSVATGNLGGLSGLGQYGSESEGEGLTEGERMMGETAGDADTSSFSETDDDELQERIRRKQEAFFVHETPAANHAGSLGRELEKEGGRVTTGKERRSRWDESERKERPIKTTTPAKCRSPSRSRSSSSSLGSHSHSRSPCSPSPSGERKHKKKRRKMKRKEKRNSRKKERGRESERSGESKREGKSERFGDIGREGKRDRERERLKSEDSKKERVHERINESVRETKVKRQSVNKQEQERKSERTIESGKERAVREIRRGEKQEGDEIGRENKKERETEYAPHMGSGKDIKAEKNKNNRKEDKRGRDNEQLEERGPDCKSNKLGERACAKENKYNKLTERENENLEDIEKGKAEVSEKLKKDEIERLKENNPASKMDTGKAREIGKEGWKRSKNVNPDDLKTERLAVESRGSRVVVLERGRKMGEQETKQCGEIGRQFGSERIVEFESESERIVEFESERIVEFESERIVEFYHKVLATTEATRERDRVREIHSHTKKRDRTSRERGSAEREPQEKKKRERLSQEDMPQRRGARERQGDVRTRDRDRHKSSKTEGRNERCGEQEDRRLQRDEHEKRSRGDSRSRKHARRRTKGEGRKRHRSRESSSSLSSTSSSSSPVSDSSSSSDSDSSSSSNRRGVGRRGVRRSGKEPGSGRRRRSTTTRGHSLSPARSRR
uniref:arginine/serine-rich protein PNISR isoform X2 n=1 Tax=Myxine glutinosa TaxID=7769 RepID=UPI00358E48E6